MTAPGTVEVAAWWSANAEGYQRWGDIAHGQEAYRQAWIDALVRLVGHPLRDGSPVLRIADIGTGTAEIALLLGGMGHDVTGYDIAPGMLTVARRKAKAEGVAVRFVPGNAYELPLGEGSVDITISRWMLWTLHDPALALREWRRVLAPGGKIVVIDTLHGIAPTTVLERANRARERAFWALYGWLKRAWYRIRHGRNAQIAASPTGPTETSSKHWQSLADVQAHFTEAGMSNVAQGWLDAVFEAHRRAAPLRWRIACCAPRFFTLTWRKPVP
ncbi:MAG: methyltransferase domain-containing protein [Egibacteraceae bacterium]